jgi:hypothetical protein
MKTFFQSELKGPSESPDRPTLLVADVANRSWPPGGVPSQFTHGAIGTPVVLPPARAAIPRYLDVVVSVLKTVTNCSHLAARCVAPLQGRGPLARCVIFFGRLLLYRIVSYVLPWATLS